MTDSLIVRSTLGVVLCLSAATLEAFAQDEERAEKVKQPDAKQALADYGKAIEQAQESYESDASAALKTLLERLQAAQETAAKENDLDEAVLIRDVRKDYEESGKAVPKPRKESMEGGRTSPQPRKEPVTPSRQPSRAGGTQVISAFYGQNVSWIDVTDKLRSWANGTATWSGVVNSRDLGDPAPGWTGQRTLIVQYMVNGRVLFKAAYEGKELSLP
jgi:hypothetical protein